MKTIEKITYEEFEKLPAGKVFAHGVATDSPEGLHMTGSGKNLRWMAIKGFANDWALYCHWEENSWPMVEREGQKVYDHDNIRNVLDVDDRTLLRYRH